MQTSMQVNSGMHHMTCNHKAKRCKPTATHVPMQQACKAQALQP